MRPQIKVREFCQLTCRTSLGLWGIWGKQWRPQRNRANIKDTSENPKVLQEKRSQDKECVALPGIAVSLLTAPSTSSPHSKHGFPHSLLFNTSHTSRAASTFQQHTQKWIPLGGGGPGLPPLSTILRYFRLTLPTPTHQLFSHSHIRGSLSGSSLVAHTKRFQNPDELSHHLCPII